MTSRARRTADALLWVGAVLGAVSLVVGALSLTGTVRPLVFTSGSMAPDIPSGSLAFARPVEAAQLEVGDVVNVRRSDGEQVTHRIQSIDRSGEQAVLTLKGDANTVADPETYTVESAHRVVVDVPWLGRIPVALDDPLPLATVAAYLAFCLLSPQLLRTKRRARRHRLRVSAMDTGRRHRAVPPRRPSRLARALVVPIVAIALVAAVAVPSWAVFTDRAEVTSATITAGSAVSPAAAVTPCTASNPGTNTVTLRWAGVNPPAAPAPPHGTYEYLLSIVDRDTNQQVGASIQTHVGAAGATQSVEYTASLLANLLGLDLATLLLGKRLRIDIRSRIVGREWIGSTTISTNFRIAAVTGTFSCS